MHGMSGDNSNDISLIQLSTPPYTLTLNEHSFPTVEDINQLNINSYEPNNKSFNKKQRNVVLSGLAPNINEEVVVM